MKECEVFVNNRGGAHLCLPLYDLPRAVSCVLRGETAQHRDGITLAFSWGVSTPLTHTGYDEPTVMWRMSRGDGQSSHAVIDPRMDGAAVIWFVNGSPLGVRDFDDWTNALRWCEQMQAQNWAAGWRVTSE